MKYLICLFASLLTLGALSSCKEKGPAEKAGEKIDRAAEKAGDTAEKVGDDIEDATN